MAGYAPAVARWLWLLTDLRERTVAVLDGLDERLLTWRPDPAANTIGTLLYHIVGIELDWLYAEILERPDYGPEVTALLPYELREPSGRLLPVEDESLANHLARMSAARQLMHAALRTMTEDDFYRMRRLPPYDVTPEWVLYHLIEHEAGHRGEIAELRRQAELAMTAEKI